MNRHCPLTLFWYKRFTNAKQNILLTIIANSNTLIDVDILMRVVYYIKKVDSSRNNTLSWFLQKENRPNIFREVEYSNVTIMVDKYGVPLIPRHLPYRHEHKYINRYSGRLFTQLDYLSTILSNFSKIEKRCLKGNDLYCRFVYTLLLIYDKRIGRVFSQELIHCKGMLPYLTFLRNGKKNIYMCQRTIVCVDGCGGSRYFCDIPDIINTSQLGFKLPSL